MEPWRSETRTARVHDAPTAPAAVERMIDHYRRISFRVERVGHPQEPPMTTIRLRPLCDKPARRFVTMVLCLAFGSAAGGCGERLPEVVPVSGTVTWQGEPLTDGTVVLHPKGAAEELPRRPATGSLDDAGRYRVSTFRTGDGALPGEYYVLVHSYLSEPSDAADDDTLVPEYVWRIPAHHGNPEQCGRVLEIPRRSRRIEYNINLDE